jgi:tripartite-type tricarboxylate transporter receptor subunit TctC
MRVTLAVAGFLLLLAPGPRSVYSMDYPTRPIRIVTAGAGGSNDFVSRLLAHGLSEQHRQPVVVDNRSGGFLPGEIVARAAPDGYTLLVAASNFWITPLLQKTPYDPVKVFAPITLVSTAPLLVVVHPSVAASVKELIALAKAKPGELNYASGPTGAPNHLGPELFKSLAGLNLVRVPYNSGGPAVNGLIGGQVQLMFATTGSVTPHVKSGRLRALAVTSMEPSALAPGLPPLAATLPGFEWISAQGVFATARTPAPILIRINQELVRVVLRPDIKENFLASGIEAVGNSPAQFAARIGTEIRRVAKLVKDTGIRAE